MKLTFGIIVFNGDFFLRQVLESIYPFAHKICIAEGPVAWWRGKGHVVSTDKTNEILRRFPDKKKKIQVVDGSKCNWREKDDQCRAWFNLVPSDTDYVVCNDADEVHTPENLERLIHYLERAKPTSVGFKSQSFFGGFERIIGGFERDHSFKRVLQYAHGCTYRTHRQPTLAIAGVDIMGRDVTGNQLHAETGIEMWHASYVSPLGVKNKIRYYEGAVISAGNCIPNYFSEVWLPWVQHPEQREAIEKKWKGVQEFMPTARGECYTEPFTGTHPAIIQRDMPLLKQQFAAELKRVVI